MKNFFLMILLLSSISLSASEKKESKKEKSELAFQSLNEVHKLNLLFIATIFNLSDQCGKFHLYEKQVKDLNGKSLSQSHNLYYQWVVELVQEVATIKNKNPGEVLFETILMQTMAQNKTTLKTECTIS